MVLALVAGIPILLLVIAMVRIDLRARRHGRRTGVDGVARWRSRRADAAREAEYRPGGGQF
jgi:hypothetical protein